VLLGVHEVQDPLALLLRGLRRAEADAVAGELDDVAVLGRRGRRDAGRDARVALERGADLPEVRGVDLDERVVAAGLVGVAQERDLSDALELAAQRDGESGSVSGVR
jgi:hypothetical protein